MTNAKPRLTTEQLESIRKRSEATTEGEWSYTVVGGKERTSTVASFGKGLTAIGEIKTVADAEFIANARTDIPKLLAEVERLRNALEYFADERNYPMDKVEIYHAEELSDKALKELNGGD